MADYEMGSYGPSTSRGGGGSAGGARGQKRQRIEGPEQTGGQQQAVKVKVMRVKANTRTASKLVGPSSHHLTKDEVPDEFKTAKFALQIHIRVAACLPNQVSVPEVVKKVDADKVLASLKVPERSSVKDELLKHHNLTVDEDNTFYRRLYDSSQSCVDGDLAPVIRQVPSQVLSMIAGACLALGLPSWRPDFLGSAGSRYNQIHEDVAIETFEQVVRGKAYNYMGIRKDVILKDLENGARVLRALYRSFVYSRLGNLLKIELKEAGSIKKSIENNNRYRRRKSLAMVRAGLAADEGAHPRIVKFLERADLQSDDEYDNNTKKYYILPKEARSEKLRHFLRALDEGHVAKPRRTTGRSPKGATFRTREHPPAPLAQADIEVLPRKDIPIDYFDPGYFNNTLTLRERVEYTAQGVRVALPSIAHIQNKTWSQLRDADWMKMPNRKFQKQYSAAVLQDYRIPTVQDRENLKNKFAADPWDTSSEGEDEEGEVSD
ncbi:hypothetical protein HDZ31DRAFT_43700 [Schizophyllum fasciatum]